MLFSSTESLTYSPVPKMKLKRFKVGILSILLGVSTFCAVPAYAQWPKAANKHRQEFAKAFRRTGLDYKYRHLLAANTAQESSWNEKAVSSANARGCGQFLIGTEADMRRWYPELLKAGSVFDCQWGITALGLYQKRLMGFQVGQTNHPDDYAISSLSVNGGHRYVLDQRKVCRDNNEDPNLYENVVKYCRNFRPESSCKENNSYWPHILRRSKRYVGF